MIPGNDEWVIYYSDGYAEIVSGHFSEARYTARNCMHKNGYGYDIQTSFPWLLAKLFKSLLSRGIGRGIFTRMARASGLPLISYVKYLMKDLPKGELA